MESRKGGTPGNTSDTSVLCGTRTLNGSKTPHDINVDTAETAKKVAQTRLRILRRNLGPDTGLTTTLSTPPKLLICSFRREVHAFPKVKSKVSRTESSRRQDQYELAFPPRCRDEDEKKKLQYVPASGQ